MSQRKSAVLDVALPGQTLDFGVVEVVFLIFQEGHVVGVLLEVFLVLGEAGERVLGRGARFGAVAANCARVRSPDLWDRAVEHAPADIGHIRCNYGDQ